MESNACTMSLPMKGGEGPYSYANNSSYQKGGIEAANAFISNEITKNLDIKKLCSSSDAFNIADFGCSVGPNAFSVARHIVEAVERRRQSQGLNSRNLEYQVFFNDQTRNDFNTLFRALPPERNYLAAGVPGSFYGRLFPKATLHFAHSSYAVHWLSKVPKEVQDRSSVAWNKGMIYCGRPEVHKAYAAQFASDMESFLDARAQELVCGGFMALLVPGIPDGASLSKCNPGVSFDLLGCCLIDMARMGLVDENKIDSFNLPYYTPSPSELEALIERNRYFKMKRMERLNRPKAITAENYSLCIRAAFEDFIGVHFGSEIIDQLFHRYKDRLKELYFFSDASDYEPMVDLLVLLERANIYD